MHLHKLETIKKKKLNLSQKKKKKNCRSKLIIYLFLDNYLTWLCLAVSIVRFEVMKNIRSLNLNQIFEI